MPFNKEAGFQGVCEHFYQSLDACSETRAIALDISKAFDKVWHARLLHKMKSYGISGEFSISLSLFCQAGK